MKFSIFKGPRKDGKAGDGDGGQAEPGARPEAARPEGRPGSGAPGAGQPPAKTVEEVKDILGTIEAVLEGEGAADTLVVPSAALLDRLPAKLRGPAWRPGGVPDLSLKLDMHDTLGQLRQGRVRHPLSTFSDVLPDGWVNAPPTTVLDLDLPQVVAAIPPERLQGAAGRSDLDATNVRTLFAPKKGMRPPTEDEVMGRTAPAPAPEVVVPAAAEPAPAAPVAAPVEEVEVSAVAAAAVGATAEVPEEEPAPVPRRSKYLPVGWDGVEASMAAAAGGIDINTATAEELQTLPGVGQTRARQIVATREDRRFENIYELALVPGIGRKLFRQMTGLSLTAGGDRHEVLNRLLDFPPGERPSLDRVVKALRERLGAVGCVLAGRDGVPIAQTESIEKVADKYAAVTAQLLRHTTRYVRQLTEDSVDCIALPLSDPPVVLFGEGDFFLIIVQDERHQGMRDLKRARSLMKELAWMLGRRAIVRNL